MSFWQVRMSSSLTLCDTILGGSGGNFWSPKQDQAALQVMPRSALCGAPQQALVHTVILPRMHRVSGYSKVG